jgi:hypothetical protein
MKLLPFLRLGTGAGLALGLLGCWGHSDHGPWVYEAVNTQAYAVAVADLNGDGKLDLVSTSPGPGFVSVDLQSSTTAGSFLDPVRSSAGLNPTAFVVASFSGFNSPGLAVVNPQVGVNPNPANGVSVLLPDPATPGGFLAPVTLAVGSRNPCGVAVSDPAASGTPFVAVAADGGSDALVFFQGASAGTFGSATSVPAGGQPTAVAVADLNGDGYPDLVVATAGSSISVILQDAANPGSFLAPVSYPVGTGPVAVVVADLNGDKLPDLVVVNGGTPSAPTSQGITVLLQNPAMAGSFLAGVSYPVGDYVSNWVAVADLNGDGKPDLAVANQGLPGQPGSVAILLQNPASAGAFQAPVLYPGLVGPTWVAIGDLNGDGLPDLAVADGGIYVLPQVQSAPGTFGAPVGFLR